MPNQQERSGGFVKVELGSRLSVKNKAGFFFKSTLTLTLTAAAPVHIRLKTYIIPMEASGTNRTLI